MEETEKMDKRFHVLSADGSCFTTSSGWMTIAEAQAVARAYTLKHSQACYIVEAQSKCYVSAPRFVPVVMS